MHQRNVDSITWTEWMEQLLLHQAGNCKGYIWQQKRALQQMAMFAETPAMVSHDTIIKIRAMLIERVQRNEITPDTANTNLRAIRTQCGLMEDLGIISRYPFPRRTKVMLKTQKKEFSDKYHVTKEEANLIFARADKEFAESHGLRGRFKAFRMRALAWLLFHSGLRAGEILWLRREDVDHARRIVSIIPRREHGLKTPSSHAKIAMPPACADVIQEWEAYLSGTECGYDYLFPQMTQNKPWISGASGYRPHEQLADLVERAGVDRIRVTMRHGRHTVATVLEANGLSDKQIQRQLRHSNTQTQLHYQHRDVEYLKQIAEGINYRKPEERIA